MPECDYCGASFEDEDAYLDHLAENHEAELSAIDQRRVDQRTDDDSGMALGPLVLGIVIGAGVLLVIYGIFFLGGGDGGGGEGIGAYGSAHEHGTINVTIAGQQVDFSQEQYQLQADKFHFEGGTEVWHKHATGVTLAFAMDTLGIGVTENSVTFQGTTYSDSDPGTEVIVEVNGEPVDPDEYVLQGASDTNPEEGDHIRIVVRTNGSS